MNTITIIVGRRRIVVADWPAASAVIRRVCWWTLLVKAVDETLKELVS